MTGRAQDGTLLAARLLLAAALLPAGLERALNVSGFALTLAASGLPMPNALATAAVVIQVFGPLAVLLGAMPRLTGALLAVFAAALAGLLHPFWSYGGLTFTMERSLFLADLGLSAGFLLYAVAGPGAFSLQGWRRGGGAPARTAKPRGGEAPPRRRSGRAPARAAA